MFGISIEEINQRAKAQATKFVRKLELFEYDSSGEMNVIKLIMGVFIMSVLVAALIPTAINSIVGGRNGSWTTNLLSAYDSIAILVVVVILAVLAAIAYRSFSD